MMKRLPRTPFDPKGAPCGLVLGALGVALLVGCGGEVRSDGSGTGGSAPTGDGDDSGNDCTFDGKVLPEGATASDQDGCNSCTCVKGGLQCTLIACAPSRDCDYDGRRIAEGESVFDADGCNTCTCMNGEMSCTLLLCLPEESCSTDQGIVYPNESIVAANGCDVCTCRNGSLECAENDCEGACDASPPLIGGKCDAYFEFYFFNVGTGRCEWGSGSGCSRTQTDNSYETLEDCESSCLGDSGDVACKVEGVVYPNGASGVPDPTSCNSCECEDGKLGACTEADCPEPCPEGTALGVQCAQCGPADGCEILETACLPTCSEGDSPECASGICVNGVCANVCG